MKKIVVNISDIDYQKFTFEAMLEKKSIQEVIKCRIFSTPFDEEIEREFQYWLEDQLIKIMNEE